MNPYKISILLFQVDLVAYCKIMDADVTTNIYIQGCYSNCWIIQHQRWRHSFLQIHLMAIILNLYLRELVQQYCVLFRSKWMFCNILYINAVAKMLQNICFLIKISMPTYFDYEQCKIRQLSYEYPWSPHSQSVLGCTCNSQNKGD